MLNIFKMGRTKNLDDVGLWTWPLHVLPFGLTDFKLIKTKVPIEVLFMVQSINILLTDNVCDIPAQLSFEHFNYFLFYIP